MAPRTSWKGFLKLSLVSVPVKAYTAHETGEEVRLNQLHKECHARVKYKKVCPEHGELTAQDIVSGYEYAKDQYVVIDGEELAKLRPQSDKAVRIDGFVQASAVDPVYRAGKTYYLLPDGVAGQKAYALLASGMAEAGVVAMAHVVIAGRDQLVSVQPVDDLLVLSVLTVAKKIKRREEFVDLLTEQEVTEDELDLTRTLIAATTLEGFDYGSYQDAHAEALTKLIQMKVDGQEIVQAPDPEEPKIINLMDALKQSVATAQAAEAAAPAGRKKKVAASAKAPRKTAAKKTAAKKAAAKPKTAAKKAAKTSRKKVAPSASAPRKKTARRKKSG